MARKIVLGVIFVFFASLFFLPLRLAREGTISPNERLWESKNNPARISRTRIIQRYGPPDKCRETDGGHVQFDYDLDFNDTRWLRWIGFRMVDRSSFMTIEFNSEGYTESFTYTSTFNAGWFQ